jgi:thioesterase domain-containing protein
MMRLFERTLGRSVRLEAAVPGQPPTPAAAARALHSAGLRLAEEDLQRVLNLYRASLRAIAGFTVPPLGSVPITFVRASQRHQDDDFLPGDQAADSCWGWATVSSNCSAPVFVPGDHVSMLVEPNVGVLAQNLAARWIGRASALHHA